MSWTWLQLRLALAAVPIGLAAAACSGPGPSSVPADPTAAAGQSLIGQKGCGTCHTIPGVPGANGVIGPSLAGVASRTTLADSVPNNGPDDLKRWIMNPAALKPGTSMPNLGLGDDEATKIVAYLETLK